VTLDLLTEAYAAMRHDLRKTLLTMLGMAWGIATVREAQRLRFSPDIFACVFKGIREVLVLRNTLNNGQ